MKKNKKLKIFSKFNDMYNGSNFYMNRSLFIVLLIFFVVFPAQVTHASFFSNWFDSKDEQHVMQTMKTNKNSFFQKIPDEDNTTGQSVFEYCSKINPNKNAPVYIYPPLLRKNNVTCADHVLGNMIITDVMPQILKKGDVPNLETTVNNFLNTVKRVDEFYMVLDSFDSSVEGVLDSVDTTIESLSAFEGDPDTKKAKRSRVDIAKAFVESDTFKSILSAIGVNQSYIQIAIEASKCKNVDHRIKKEKQNAICAQPFLTLFFNVLQTKNPGKKKEIEIIKNATNKIVEDIETNGIKKDGQQILSLFEDKELVKLMTNDPYQQRAIKDVATAPAAVLSCIDTLNTTKDMPKVKKVFTKKGNLTYSFSKAMEVASDKIDDGKKCVFKSAGMFLSIPLNTAKSIRIIQVSNATEKVQDNLIVYMTINALLDNNEFGFNYSTVDESSMEKYLKESIKQNIDSMDNFIKVVKLFQTIIFQSSSSKVMEGRYQVLLKRTYDNYISINNAKEKIVNRYLNFNFKANIYNTQHIAIVKETSNSQIIINEEKKLSSNQRIVTVITNSLRVRLNSGIDSKYLGSVHTGEKGTILDGPKKGDKYIWYKVKFNKGITGWVADEFITFEPPAKKQKENSGFIGSVKSKIDSIKDAFSDLKRKVSDIKNGIDKILVFIEDVSEVKDEINGCMAEIAYGVSRNDDLVIMRRFRDNILAKSVVGQIIIEKYYAISPFVVKKIENREINRLVIKKLFFEPAVGIVRIINLTV